MVSMMFCVKCSSDEKLCKKQAPTFRRADLRIVGIQRVFAIL